MGWIIWFFLWQPLSWLVVQDRIQLLHIRTKMFLKDIGHKFESTFKNYFSLF